VIRRSVSSVRRVVARRTEHASREAGTTMAELVTAMALMTVFMTIFTASVSIMYKSINKVTSLADSTSQLNQAFVRLDHEVRYSAAISTPGTTAKGWYVELKTTTTGSIVCTQLQITPTATITGQPSGQLRRRTWTVSAAGSTNQPFVLAAPTAIFTYQTLAIRVLETSGGGDSPTSAVSAVTYTALNSTVATTPTGVCTEVARP
jgi:hypothetical protein